MPHRSAETATYPGEMARFEIQIPDRRLALLDNVCEDAGETREELLSRIAEEALVRAGDVLRVRFLQELGPPMSLGGNNAQIIREMRDQRLPPAYRDDPDEV
jgi:hypothetical protein